MRFVSGYIAGIDEVIGLVLREAGNLAVEISPVSAIIKIYPVCRSVTSVTSVSGNVPTARKCDGCDG